VTTRGQEALVLLQQLRRNPGNTRFLLPVLEYLVHDIFGNDDSRGRRARKALLDCVDGYTTQVLAIPR
ncbi:MAG: hypothetical protein LUO86_02215, partial [Methanomicrobiales archaeon]|nr:hypothetical protein [Methanomicrobiales archaeon]